MELYFIRHGETEGNINSLYCGWTETNLTDNGIEQAKAAAERIKQYNITHIWASPLKRASDTARIISGQTNIQVVYSEYIKERNFGIWENLTFAQISEKYPDTVECYNKDWSNYVLPGGESFVESGNRGMKLVKEIIDTYDKDSKVLFVSHGAMISALINKLLEMPPVDGYRFRIVNCGICCIKINETGYAYMTLLNG